MDLITNKELKQIDETISEKFNSFRAGAIDKESFISHSRDLQATHKRLDRDIQKNLLYKQYPKSYDFDKQTQIIGQMQRSNAYQVYKEDASMLKQLLKSEIEQKNYDFCFQLTQLVNSSTASDPTKASLSNVYSELCRVTQVDVAFDETQESLMLKKKFDAVENTSNLDTDAFIDTLRTKWSGIEMELALNREKSKRKLLEL